MTNGRTAGRTADHRFSVAVAAGHRNREERRVERTRRFFRRRRRSVAGVTTGAAGERCGGIEGRVLRGGRVRDLLRPQPGTRQRPWLRPQQGHGRRAPRRPHGLGTRYSAAQTLRADAASRSGGVPGPCTGTPELHGGGTKQPWLAARAARGTPPPLLPQDTTFPPLLRSALRRTEGEHQRCSQAASEGRRGDPEMEAGKSRTNPRGHLAAPIRVATWPDQFVPVAQAVSSGAVLWSPSCREI